MSHQATENATELLHAADGVERAITLLRAGALVAVPTETVYGLAADASNPLAVAKIFTAKGRPANHPLIVHLGQMSQLADWAVDIPAEAYLLAQAFWPGPLTLLLNKAPKVSDVVTGGKQTIGLRLPAHPLLLQILQQSGLAVAAPSANPYKKLSPTSAEQVLAGLNGKIAAVLDGGDCQVGLESTIVDLSGGQVQVLRAGPVSAAELEAVLGVPITTPQSHNVAVPGNVKAHYQPSKPLQMFSRNQLLKLLPAAQDVILICHSHDVANNYKGTILRLASEKTAYARALYRTLFQADSLAGSQIWLEQPPQEPAWADVNDRLARACHP